MSNYRRLISYIYAYEGEVKGKNIGFVKLESRGGQCQRIGDGAQDGGALGRIDARGLTIT